MCSSDLIATLLVGDQEFDSPKTLSAFALGFVLFGYTAPAVVAGVAALAMAGYAIKSRFAATQTSSISS